MHMMLDWPRSSTRGPGYWNLPEIRHLTLPLSTAEVQIHSTLVVHVVSLVCHVVHGYLTCHSSCKSCGTFCTIPGNPSLVTGGYPGTWVLFPPGTPPPMTISCMCFCTFFFCTCALVLVSNLYRFFACDVVGNFLLIACLVLALLLLSLSIGFFCRCRQHAPVDLRQHHPLAPSLPSCLSLAHLHTPWPSHSPSLRVTHQILASESV